MSDYSIPAKSNPINKPLKKAKEISKPIEEPVIDKTLEFKKEIKRRLNNIVLDKQVRNYQSIVSTVEKIKRYHPSFFEPIEMHEDYEYLDSKFTSAVKNKPQMFQMLQQLIAETFGLLKSSISKLMSAFKEKENDEIPKLLNDVIFYLLY